MTVAENAEHYRKLERMYLAAPINEFFKPAIQIGRGTAEIKVNVDSRFFHAARAAHGPAQVATDTYRRNWDAIFGGPKGSEPN